MKSGCTLYYGNGQSVELDAGWYKAWQFENVYGWEYIGPDFIRFVDLVVLDHEPDEIERAEIEMRFVEAIAPDGTKGLQYPPRIVNVSSS